MVRPGDLFVGPELTQHVRMVSGKTLLVSALLFANVFAIQIMYEVKYQSGYHRRVRSRPGQAITDEQAARVKSNIYLWSQGMWQAREENGLLKIFNDAHVQGGVPAADAIIEQMVASINYHVRGGGAPPHTHRGSRMELDEDEGLEEAGVA